MGCISLKANKNPYNPVSHLHMTNSASDPEHCTKEDLSGVERRQLEKPNMKACKRLHHNPITNAQISHDVKYEFYTLRYSSSVGGSTPKYCEI